MRVAAAHVVAHLLTLPSAAEHRLTQIWRVSQVQARVCKGTIIITFTSTEEPGAKFRASKLLPHYWLHRRGRRGKPGEIGQRVACAEMAVRIYSREELTTRKPKCTYTTDAQRHKRVLFLMARFHQGGGIQSEFRPGAYLNWRGRSGVHAETFVDRSELRVVLEGYRNDR